MKFKDLLKDILLREIGDTADGYEFSVSRSKISDGGSKIDYRYSFESQGGFSYVVQIEQDPRGRPYPEVYFFTIEKLDDMTGENDPFNIIATVVNCVKHFVEDAKAKGFDIEAVRFEAEPKKSESGFGENAREKMYKQFVKRQFPSAKVRRDHGDTMIYLDGQYLRQRKDEEKKKFTEPIKKMALHELGNTTDTFDWRLSYDSETEKVYEFSTPENRYEAFVESFTEDWLALDFGIEDMEFGEKFSTVTNEGEQFRVVATVLEIAEHAWNRRETMMDGDTVKGFSISTDPRRIRLYKTFVKRQFPDAEVKSTNDTMSVKLI